MILKTGKLSSLLFPASLRNIDSRGAKPNSGRKPFSLLEMVIVISITAITASFVVPILAGIFSESRKKVVIEEMRNIIDAFGRLDADCNLTDAQLKDFSEYGLWALMRMEHPADPTKNFTKFDIDRYKGWRGRYLPEEGSVNIDPLRPGQLETPGGVEIPVIKDPYNGYYRVLIPRNGLPEDLVLACTGPNGILDSSPDNTNAKGEIIPVDDDMIERLIP